MFLVIMLKLKKMKQVVAVVVALATQTTPLQMVAHQVQKPNRLLKKMKQAVAAWQAS